MSMTSSELRVPGSELTTLSPQQNLPPVHRAKPLSDDLPTDVAIKLADHAATIEEHQRVIRMTTVQRAILIGREIKAAQALLASHGKGWVGDPKGGWFGRWVKNSLGMPMMTAYQYMLCADFAADYPELVEQFDYTAIVYVTYTKVKDAKQKAIELARSGERVTSKRARELVGRSFKYRYLNTPPEQNDELEPAPFAGDISQETRGPEDEDLEDDVLEGDGAEGDDFDSAAASPHSATSYQRQSADAASRGDRPVGPARGNARHVGGRLHPAAAGYAPAAGKSGKSPSSSKWSTA